MKAKFKLTDEYKINAFGVKLFRIEATVDIEARGIKKGEKGGFVEKEENLSGNAWVYGNAEVYGNARVYDDAWVYDDAEVYGNARVSGNAGVSGNARVSGNAWVYGNARVYGNAWVSGNAGVSGNAWVYGNAGVSGNARVSGNAWVYGNAGVSGNAWVSGNKHYTKGWFIGGDDTGKITNVTDQMGTDYWKAQYVLGDYEITNKTPEKKENPKEIQIDGATYVLREDK